MATAAQEGPTRPELSAEDKKLLGEGTKLGKVARYTGNALNIMLTVLKEASAGTPILRPIAGSALAALETVQMMDDNHNLIALVLVDVVETSYVVTLALQNSDQAQEQTIEKKLSSYIDTFEAKLQGIHKKLRKLLKPKAGFISRLTQVKGHKNTINDLHEELKKERANLHLLISALTYRRTVCQLPNGQIPVDHNDLRKYAEEKADLQFQSWQQQQRETAAAIVNSQVGNLTARRARGNAVGTQGTIVNGDNFKGSNTLNHITRGDTRHNTKIGTVGNYNAGDVHGTLNQGCNTMYFGPGHQSLEPVPQPGWQQQQWSQRGYSQPNQPQSQQYQWPQGGCSPNQAHWPPEDQYQGPYSPQHQWSHQ